MLKRHSRQRHSLADCRVAYEQTCPSTSAYQSPHITITRISCHEPSILPSVWNSTLTIRITDVPTIARGNAKTAQAQDHRDAHMRFHVLSLQADEWHKTMQRQKAARAAA